MQTTNVHVKSLDYSILPLPLNKSQCKFYSSFSPQLPIKKRYSFLISETSKKTRNARSMAAAYAALVSLFNDLELIQNHPRHSFSFDNRQIESLFENVAFLIDFMERPDSHGGSKEDEDVLERQIASAANAAEDVIESHVVDQIRGGSSLGEKSTSHFLPDLQDVIEEMGVVRRRAIKARKAKRGMEVEHPEYSPAATASTPVKNGMVGFEGVKYQLMDFLTGEPTSRRVIPIVGMGGIGKTTLAQNAFEDKYLERHFEVRVWAAISQHYSVKQILLRLLSREGESTSQTVAELGEQLHKKLWGRRYLIVLDDVWSVEAWYKIQLFFPDDGNTSRIVLTTRLRTVADYFGSSCLAVDFLDKDKSWDLFCGKAFPEQVCPSKLVKTGKKIVEKCKGLPLAIVVVAGHLGKSSRTQEYWENVANRMNSILDDSGEIEEQLFDILSLSYSQLPIHLKPCFLYMGTFPGDGWNPVSELIKLWVSEGFVKQNKAQSWEETAEAYLKDLIVRNLILFTIFDGEVQSFKIHDVLRELCMKIVEKEKFFRVLHASRAIDRERKVVINESIPLEMHHSNNIHALKSASLVRSLKFKGGEHLFDMKLLRVLDNRAVMNEVDGDFLEANFEQVNLRYLSCLKADHKYKTSPSLYLSPSISLLWNLQTIIVKGAYPLVIAPNGIWEMVQLRHLQFRRISLPEPLGNDLVLPYLQTLRNVENLKLNEEVCKRIPIIKDLHLAYKLKKACDEPRSYCPYNLGRLNKLESLSCSFSIAPEWRDFALSLQLPSSLKKLSLNNSRFDWESLTTTVGSLPHLEILSLYADSVIGSEWTPIQGKFRRLKCLTIDGCDDLVNWNAECSHFPVLEKVILEELSKLDEFPSSLGDITTVRRIALTRCSVSSAVSALKMLIEQEELHANEGIQLEVSFSGQDEKLVSFWEKMDEDDLRSNNLVVFPV